MSSQFNFKEGVVYANGIELHYVEHGSGPLVLFCHGWPESWYSWRHQLQAVGDAGYRAVALHMRGYGKTTQPEDVEAYTISSLVGDVVGSVAGLGESEAIVVGHDWGGPVAWYSALMRPDVFRAVAVLSVPFNPPFPLPAGIDLNDVMRESAAGRQYYRLFFQEQGVAEADFERDVRKSMLGVLYVFSGDIVRDQIHEIGWDGHFPIDETMTEQFVIPEKLPEWLTEADLDFYVKEHTAAGFSGGFNWYRNIKRLPAHLAPFVGKSLEQPALYLYGEHDLVAGNTPEALHSMQATLPDLRKCLKFEGAGHWLQQERADEVNKELIEFFASLA
tara:strand:- start:1025 stop:2020 length:996 start_codon:yes stop_codon:yes gene_type:complete